MFQHSLELADVVEAQLLSNDRTILTARGIFTSKAITPFADARQMIAYYVRRWRIEKDHKALKTGYRRGSRATLREKLSR